MGRAIHHISGRVTFSNNVAVAVTMAEANSNIVRPGSGRIFLSKLWGDLQFDGFVRFLSANLHDSTLGVTASIEAGEVKQLLPVPQYLVREDNLTIQILAPDAAADIENFGALIVYDDLKGIAANLITYEDAMRRGKHVTTVRQTITTGAGGGYTGEEALNAEGAASSQLLNERRYALLGATVNTEGCSVCMRGPDTGNLRIGIPTEPGNGENTKDFFLNWAKETGEPLIPVIQGQNIGQTTVDAIQDENAAAIPVCWYFLELV